MELLACWVISENQLLNQMRIYNLVEHLRWSFYKNSWRFLAADYFNKKAI